MKKSLVVILLAVIAAGSNACRNERSKPFEQAAIEVSTANPTEFCMGCHSATSALGNKILWAQAGWQDSVHAKGQVEEVWIPVPVSGFKITGVTVTGNGTSGCTGPFSFSFNQPLLLNTATAPTDANVVLTPTITGGTLTGLTVTSGGLFATAPTTITLSKGGCTTTPTATITTGAYAGPANLWVLEGATNGGSNAFYANAAGCQICHTHEGFRKKIAGTYGSVTYGGMDAASLSTATSLLRTDVISNPSPQGCFTCHTPHDSGNFNRPVPDGTAVQTELGRAATPTAQKVATYAKSKGNICVSCHMIRTSGLADATGTINPIILGALRQGASASSIGITSSSWGPHHGPQADLLLGLGGAEYNYTLVAGTVTVGGTYGNSAHTDATGADCVSCHMQSDYQDFTATSSFSLNPSLGGHAMSNVGWVHGAQKAMVAGCGSAGCHTVTGITSGGNGPKIASSLAGSSSTTLAAEGHLLRGDVYFDCSAGTTGSTCTTANASTITTNRLLTALANPNTACSGLITSAWAAIKPLAGQCKVGATPAPACDTNAAGATQCTAANTCNGSVAGTWTATDIDVTWKKFLNGTTNPRCIDGGMVNALGSSTLAPYRNLTANVVDNDATGSVTAKITRFAKARYNFKFIQEDKSFGVHNRKYATQLLWDSCADLCSLVSGDANATAGNCSVGAASVAAAVATVCGVRP